MDIRLKLGAIVLSVVLTLLGVVYLFVVSPVQREMSGHVRADITRSVDQLYALSQRDGQAASQLAEHLAHEDRVISAMSTTCAGVTRRDDCLARQHRDAAAAIETWLLDGGSAESRAVFPTVDLSIAIASRLDGVVVARFVGDVFDWWGDSAINLVDNLDLVASAVTERRTQWGAIVWTEGSGAGETALLAGVAPVWNAGEQLVGTVLLGWPLNDQMASLKQNFSGRSVFYALDGSISGASSQELLAELQDMTFLATGAHADAEMDFASILTTGQSSQPYRGARQARDIIIVRSAFPGSGQDSQRVGYAVVSNLSSEFSSTTSSKLWLLVSGLIILLLGFTGVVIVTHGFVKPLVRIDQGIQQVVAGDRDYVWQVEKHPHHSQLAHSLNVMSAVLQDKTIPGDDETAEDKNWEAMLHFAELESTGQRIPKLEIPKPRIPNSGETEDAIAKVAAEPEEAYLHRLFDDYVTARSSLNIGSEQIRFDRFVVQVNKNSELFKRKYGCKDVRFKVVVKTEKVVLKPIPVK